MLSPKAQETLRLIKETEFLRKDLLMVFRDASTRVADNLDDENRIAKEIYNNIIKELLK
jgi:hypothetical protein